MRCTTSERACTSTSSTQHTVQSGNGEERVSWQHPMAGGGAALGAGIAVCGISWLRVVAPTRGGGGNKSAVDFLPHAPRCAL
jgi:hypothetical protein